MVAVGYTSGDERKLDLTGGTMTGPLILDDDPADDLEAATKQYVDAQIGVDTSDFIEAAGGTMTGPLVLDDDPSTDLQAATKGYVDGEVATALPLAGGTLTGDLVLNGSPASGLHAATKAYVDASGGGFTVTAVKTSAYTAVASDLIPVDTTAGSVTITLPTAPTDGTRIAVKHVVRGSTNTVTIARGGSDVFNVAAGSTSLTLTLLNQGVQLLYKSGSAIWYVTSSDHSLSQLDLRYPLASNNLSDLASAATARTNLGLAGAALLAVGTTAGTVAAGDDSRFTSSTVTAVKTSGYTAAAGEFVPVDTTSGSVTITLPTAPADGARVAVKHAIRGGTNTVAIARGGSDVFNVAGTTSYTLTLLNQHATFTYKASTAIWYVVDSLTLAQLDLRYPLISNNLSDLASASTARTNLGLGAAALLATGTTAGTVAAGDHTHTPSTLTLATVTPSDHGYLTWSIDPAYASSGSEVSGAGVLQMVKVKLAVAATISTACIRVTTAGTSLSNCYLALYDSSGTRQAVTATLTGSWNSTGYYEHNFASPYVAAAGTYYVGILVGSASTIPQFSRSTTGIVVNAGLSAGALRFSTYSSGLSAAPSNVTMASQTSTTSATAVSFFVALK